jgi:hypothetical protein
MVLHNYKTDLPIKKACASARAFGLASDRERQGLSSSAALCVLVARAFNRLYDLKLTVRGEMDIAYHGELRTPSRCGGSGRGAGLARRQRRWQVVSTSVARSAIPRCLSSSTVTGGRERVCSATTGLTERQPGRAAAARGGRAAHRAGGPQGPQGHQGDPGQAEQRLPVPGGECAPRVPGVLLSAHRRRPSKSGSCTACWAQSTRQPSTLQSQRWRAAAEAAPSAWESSCARPRFAAHAAVAPSPDRSALRSISTSTLLQCAHM